MSTDVKDLNRVVKEEFVVVGLSLTGTFEQIWEIGPLWQRFTKQIGQVRNIVDEKTVIGVSYDRPPTDFTYYAAVEVSSAEELPAGMSSCKVPTSEYAVFTHEGLLDTLGETYRRIYHEYLPNAGLERNWSAPVLEVYDERYIANSPDSVFEILVPLA